MRDDTRPNILPDSCAGVGLEWDQLSGEPGQPRGIGKTQESRQSG